MTDSVPAILTTPKRKRSQPEKDDLIITSVSTSALSPGGKALPPSSPVDDGSSSPRSRVAHRFRRLVIGRPHPLADTTGGATSRLDAPDQKVSIDDVMQQETENDAAAGARKRLKLPEQAIPGPQPSETTSLTSQQPQGASVASVCNNRAIPPLAKLVPSSAAMASTESDFRWPPCPLPATALTVQAEAITAALRASMTWHEDEITIYDPDDSDDDGTGINGIGFKPTPAVAHARGVKRKQQLAEYRKREEREARARRSQRRRGTPQPARDAKVESPAKEGHKEKEKQRPRVRFLEGSVLTPAAAAAKTVGNGSGFRFDA